MLQNKKSIYLDNSATTPLDPAVLDAMMPFLQENFGNAGSRNHSYGWTAEEGVDKARAQVADLINCKPNEMIFTSGATESNNIAILGIAEKYENKGKHIISCSIEHKAVIDPIRYLQEKRGYDVTFLDVGKDGIIDIDDLKNAIRKDTVLISIMAANNEIGTINPIAQIGHLAKEYGIFFHTDATQAVGKIPIDVNEMGIDLMSFSGHKIYGPKGIGGLYVRKRNPRVLLTPRFFGGGQERDIRSGTLNVPGIVGLGKACEICNQSMKAESERITGMRNYLEETIFNALDHVEINGDRERRLPNISNISFAYVEGESLMMGMENVAVSSGSACTSASLEPSYVLKALGVGDELAHSSIRFSIGRFNTQQEVEEVASEIIRVVNKLRDMSPLYEMVQEGIDLKTVQWTGH